MNTQRKFKHLTWEKRLQIEALFKAGLKARAIAKEIGCSFKTIYNELKRGEYKHTRTYYDKYGYEPKYRSYKSYSPNIAQELYEINMSSHGLPIKIGNDFELANYIETRIVDDGLTPLAVLGEIKQKKLHFKTTICVQTLYNYIRSGVFLRLSLEHLPFYKKNKRNKKKIVIKKLPRGQSIEKRSLSATNRSEFGHWEMDCIESCKTKKTALLCLSERLARKEIIFKLSTKNSENVINCLNSLERKYGDLFPKVFKTITVDNGPEFSNYIDMQRSIFSKQGKRTTIYYCHPYCSSERGTNERMNREIRRKFPKGTDFSLVSIDEIAKVETWLNSYPRGVLNYDTPENVYKKCLQTII